MRNVLNRGTYHVSFDKAFGEVIEACANVTRTEEGTWIGEDMIEAYTELHQLGMAHSVEVWENEELVGGLYGISLGSAFFGESMFSLRSNASKIALISLVRHSELSFDLIDCQIYNEHLATLGAEEIPRSAFLEILSTSLTKPTKKGSWSELTQEHL